METEYQNYNMVCSNDKCKCSFRLQKGERFASPYECFQCGNIMEREEITVDIVLDKSPK